MIITIIIIIIIITIIIIVVPLRRDEFARKTPGTRGNATNAKRRRRRLFRCELHGITRVAKTNSRAVCFKPRR